MYLGENLIFILSTPRSGSTLLQRLIANNPDIFSDVESWFLLHPLYAMHDSGINTEYGHSGALGALNHYLNSYANGLATFREAVRQYAQVLYESALHKEGKKFFLDKSPPYTRVGRDVVDLFPKARFIILKRNPMAVLRSVLTTWTNGQWDKLYWSHYDLLSASTDLMDVADYLGNRAVHVCYEDLVSDPQITMAELCSKLNLRWDSDWLTYSIINRPMNQNRYPFFGDPKTVNNINRPIEQSSDKWLELTNNPQTMHFAEEYLAALGPNLFNRLGYDYQFIRDALATRAKSKKESFPLVPWSLAIKKPEQRTKTENLLLSRIELVQEFGRFQGLARYLKINGVAHLRNSIRNLSA